MEITQWVRMVEKKHGPQLMLTGLAGLQYPTVLTRQLTFYNPSGNKMDYHVGPCHVLIRRTSKKEITVKDHILFIAGNIELYSEELDLLLPILSDISLKDLESHDKAWRIFAYLKKHCLHEKILLKKIIGRRTIDIGDVSSPSVVKDTLLHIRDGLLVPFFQKEKWKPHVGKFPNRSAVDKEWREARRYFEKREVLPLFHKFRRYASRLESAASAKIEGYDAKVEAHALSERTRERLKKNIALQVSLNMDNLHRDLKNISKDPLSLELLFAVQEAIVHKTWKNEEEKFDKTPGVLRPFDEVIVEKGSSHKDNVVYVAPKWSDVPVLLKELLDFYYFAQNTMHPLDLASIFHCQLVVIHPFGDGNGRLARWCFQHILIRCGFISSIHQAPISYIFLNERDHYYREINKVDGSVMRAASYSIDKETKRYQAQYDDLDIYKKLDYTSWLSYVYDAFTRALKFSREEHAVFERTQTILQSFEDRYQNMTAGQEHEIHRALDIGLKKEWGKKTEQRLMNNGLSLEAIEFLRSLIKKA